MPKLIHTSSIMIVMHDTSATVIILEVFVLVMVSAVCSGLNVAFMSLDIADLRRKSKLGNKHAKSMLPLRKKTHLTLGSILFTNVAAVSATSLVLDQRLDGWAAGLISTLLIVIFGEVIPRHYFLRIHWLFVVSFHHCYGP